MTLNATAWLFIPESERVIADYLRGLLAEDVQVEPALSSTAIRTPHVAVRNTRVSPYTSGAAIVSNVETTTTITIRTAISEEAVDAGRDNHHALVSAVMGCLMVVDETTHENALPAELNALGNESVTFSMAAWNGNTSGADEENRHFITRVELATIINPKTEA